MKKLLVLCSFLVLACTSVLAAPNAPAKIEVFFGQPDLAIDFSHIASLKSKNSQGTVMTASGAAPALSYLQVSYVGSSNIGWEAIAPNQGVTSYDHGGAQLRVVTDELGYGSIPFATMNGSQLPSSSNYYTQPICQDAYGNYTLSCSAGQSIVGWRKYWSVDGYQSGLFYYQNMSTNSPWNTMSDSISIR